MFCPISYRNLYHSLFLETFRCAEGSYAVSSTFFPTLSLAYPAAPGRAVGIKLGPLRPPIGSGRPMYAPLGPFALWSSRGSVISVPKNSKIARYSGSSVIKANRTADPVIGCQIDPRSRKWSRDACRHIHLGKQEEEWQGEPHMRSTLRYVSCGTFRLLTPSPLKEEVAA